jgi:hypothetical protein
MALGRSAQSAQVLICKFPRRLVILWSALATLFVALPFIALDDSRLQLSGYIIVEGFAMLIGSVPIYYLLYAFVLESDRITVGAVWKRTVLCADITEIRVSRVKGGDICSIKCNGGTSLTVDGGLGQFQDLVAELERRTGIRRIGEGADLGSNGLSNAGVGISNYNGVAWALAKGIAMILLAAWMTYQIQEIALRKMALISTGWFVAISGGLMGGAGGYAFQTCRRALEKLRAKTARRT